jgi:asparagine synthase (glutamine-hydrolysing)
VCGFVGVVRSAARGPVRAAELEALVGWVEDRGPDGWGVLADGGLGLLASRLAIQGGRESDQPLRSADGRFVLAYNGELFASHRRRLRGALRTEGAGEPRVGSDTGLLLAWLEHRLRDRDAGDPFPPDAVSPLAGGMYAFALLDLATREAILHDDGAVKPLHVAASEARGETWFASTQAPLLAVAGGPRSLDEAELAARLVGGFGDGPLCRAALAPRELAGDVVLVAERDAARPRRVHGPARTGGGAPADVKDLSRAFAEAAREAGEVAGPVSLFLSGGLDSAAVAAGCGRHDALALTGRFGPAGGPFDETEGAAAVAASLGLRHEVVDLSDGDLLADLADVVEALEEPVGGPGSLALHRMALRARAHGRVALSGTGGDERLGGYARVAIALGRDGAWTRGYEGLARRMDAAGPDPRARWLASVDRSPDLLPWLSRDLAARLPVEAARRRLFDRLFGEGSGADAVEPARALVRAEEATTLRTLLRVEDRVTMAVALESRPVPCLGAVPEVAARLPAEWLVGPDGEGKRALRAALHGAVPETVRTDPRKRGFPTPFDRAARGVGRAAAEALLDDPRTKARGWWDVPACRRLLADASPREGHDRALFAVLALETWARRFLDGEAFSRRAAAAP